MTRELRLLILTARLHLDAAARAEVHALLSDLLDWREVLLEAQRLGSGPLLYRHLSTEEYSPLVPTQVLHDFRLQYRSCLAANLRNYASLRKILQALNKAEVPVILLKGSYLANWVYGDIGLRPMSDMDILCRYQDRDTVCETLTALGYSQGEEDGAKFHSPFHQEMLTRHGVCHLPAFYHPRTCRIEVHLSLFHEETNTSSQPMILMDEAWHTSVELTWEGVTARSLSPEFQLLHQCLHLIKHLEAGAVTLYWLCDIHEIISFHTESLDWENFLALSRKLGAEGKIRALLETVRTRWKTPLPDFPSTNRSTLPLRLDLTAQGTSPLSIYQGAFTHYLRLISLMREVPGLKNRIHYLLRLLFPQRDNMIFRYKPANEWILFGCYLFHPFVLAGKLLLSIALHMRNR